MRLIGILLINTLCLVGVSAEVKPSVQPSTVPETSLVPEAPVQRPGLVEFMTGYCEAILHVRTDEAGDVVVDYWKIDDGEELAREETLAYLEARKLTEDLSADLSKVFFLRRLTEKELGEILHFAARIKDEEKREKFKSDQYKYALVKLISVQDGRLEVLEPNRVRDSGEDSTAPTAYTLDDFRARVMGYLQAAPETVESADGE